MLRSSVALRPCKEKGSESAWLSKCELEGSLSQQLRLSCLGPPWDIPAYRHRIPARYGGSQPLRDR